MTDAPSPARLSIYDAAAANRVRTVVLIVAFVLIVVVLAYAIGEYFGNGSGAAIVPFAFRRPEDAPLRHGPDFLGLARWLQKTGRNEEALRLLRRKHGSWASRSGKRSRSTTAASCGSASC